MTVETKTRRNIATNITSRAYDTLRSMILEQRLQPGDVVEERRLADEFNISRTPLRAAISRLIGENLLTRLSNGTLVVQNLTLEDFIEAIQIRKLLEAEAASSAAGRMPKQVIAELRGVIIAFEEANIHEAERHWAIDDRFHRTIAAYANNKLIERLIDDVRNRVRMCNIGRVPSRLEEACREHLALLDAIEAGDAELARQRMIEHIGGVSNAFFAMLGQANR